MSAIDVPFHILLAILYFNDKQTKDIFTIEKLLHFRHIFFPLSFLLSLWIEYHQRSSSVKA